MATDIKVVKTVFVVDTDDIKKATKDYNNLADSIDKTGKELADTGKKATEGSQKVKDGVDKSKQSVDKFKSSFDGIGSVIAGAFAIGSVVAFGKSVIDITSQVQKYRAVLTNTLGSQNLADMAMGMISDTAIKTNFSVMELTDTYIKFANRGLKLTSGEMMKLADIANSTGKSIDQLTEATLDAFTGENERLKEFGITAKRTGETTQYTFKGVTTEVRNTQQAIKEYLIGLGDLNGVLGSTNAISQTLGGQISNLGDKWDKFLTGVGNRTSVIFGGAISFIADRLDFLEKIMKSKESEIAESTINSNNFTQSSITKFFESIKTKSEKSKQDQAKLMEEGYNAKKVLYDKEVKQAIENLSEIAEVKITGQQSLDGGMLAIIKGTANKEKLVAIQSMEEDLKIAKFKNEELKRQYESYLKSKEVAINQQTEKELKARQKALQDAFKLELDLLKREEQRKLQEGKNADNPQSKQLQIEDDYNYKRIQIYSKWDSILNKQDKEAKKDLIVNIDTLAKGISEATNKEYEALLKSNQEYYDKLNDQTKQGEKKLNEGIERERNMSQSKLSLEKSAKLKAIYEDENLNYKQQQQEKDNIDLEYSEKENQIDIDSLKKKLALDDELTAKYALNSDERLKIEAEIANLELKAQTEKNAKIIKDEEEKDKKIRQIAIDGQKFAKQLIDSYFTYQSQLNTAKIAEYQTQKEKELEAVDANEDGKAKVYTKAEAQKMAINEKYRQLEANVKRRQFELDKQKALIDIAINTAVGVSKAYAQGGVLGVVTGGLVIAAGALQTAMITSQPTPKFAKGGQIKGRTHAEGGQIIEAERDEWVINANASREFHPLLKAINEGTFTRKDLSPELSNMMFGQKMSNINLNTDSLAKELRGMPKNHISLDKEGFKTFLYSENLKQESLNNRYLS